MSQIRIKEATTDQLKPMLVNCLRDLLEKERSSSPGNDQTGERQHEDGDAYYLVGSFGNIEPVVRRLTLIEKKPIFVLACSCDDSFAEDRKASSTEDLYKRARGVFGAFDVAAITIVRGGQSQKFSMDDLKSVETEVIEIVFPEDNVYKDKYLVRGGKTYLVGCARVGYFDLEPGEYRIIIEAHHPAKEQLDITEFNVDVSYVVNVIHKVVQTKTPTQQISR